MRRTPLIPAAAAAISLLAASFAPAANAAEGEVVADGLFSPLSVAVAADGTAFVSQNFLSQITMVAPGGEPEPIFADEGQREVGGLSVTGDVITFVTTSQGGPASADLYTLTPGDDGYEQTHVANLWAHEKARNADGKKTYGISGLSKTCKKAIPKQMRKFVVAYKGIKESHPYATAVSGDTTYVADAAANAIWAVKGGKVRTVAVLPAVSVKVTKKLRKGMGLPKCTQGKTFKSEPVPTDVEIGPDGNLYVTTLGGGLGEMMPLGAVHQVNPTTGAVARQTAGLFGPTGLAISPTGTAYVSLMFGGVVMQQPFGEAASVLAEVPAGPGDVEYANGSVYVTSASINEGSPADPKGQLLKFD